MSYYDHEAVMEHCPGSTCKDCIQHRINVIRNPWGWNPAHVTWCAVRLSHDYQRLVSSLNFSRVQTLDTERRLKTVCEDLVSTREKFQKYQTESEEQLAQLREQLAVIGAAVNVVTDAPPNNPFRVRTRLLKVNDHYLPEPLRKEPPKGTILYRVNPASDQLWSVVGWDPDSELHQMWLAGGQLHDNPVVATQWAEAWLSTCRP